VFTARTPAIATSGGITSGVYCLVYGLAGALIGTAAHTLYPDLASAQDAFATIVERLLPTGVRGLVLAAALSAMMSTASGALIACSTTTTSDLLTKIGLKKGGEVRRNRIATLVLGLIAIGIAMVVDDVVNALTIAYDILVGGLLVAIIGGMIWKRGTIAGALVSIATDTVLTLGTMAVYGDIYANEPIFAGLIGSLLTFVVVSLLTRPTSPEIRAEWDRRVNHRRETAAADATV
jgi:SSS family solute:Na+ symporter